jgi:D-tyrosyl-tRNA(Tyr) deacylase
VTGEIHTGLLVYVGVASDDGAVDVAYIADKVCSLRIFPDESDKLNLDVNQSGGEVLVVSAFSLQGDARKGRRPSFDAAAPPEHARIMYEMLCDALTGEGLAVQRGSFGDRMQVQSVNEGPVCIMLDSKKLF